MTTKKPPKDETAAPVRFTREEIHAIEAEPRKQHGLPTTDEVEALVAAQPATQPVTCRVCGHRVAKGGVCDVDGTREGA